MKNSQTEANISPTFKAYTQINKKHIKMTMESQLRV